MSLSDRIQKSMVEAMKKKDALRVSTLRMVRSSIKNAEIEKKEVLKDPDVVSVLRKMAKQREDSIEQFQKADRKDLVDKEQLELKILQEFLPSALSGEELQKIIDQMAEELSATTMKDMGKLMKAVLEKAAGRADGKVVSERVKEKLK